MTVVHCCSRPRTVIQFHLPNLFLSPPASIVCAELVPFVIMAVPPGSIDVLLDRVRSHSNLVIVLSQKPLNKFLGCCRVSSLSPFVLCSLSKTISQSMLVKYCFSLSLFMSESVPKWIGRELMFPPTILQHFACFVRLLFRGSPV